MTMYTSLPPETLYHEVPVQPVKQKKLLMIGDVQVEVELFDQNKLKIERIISSDPWDYLIPGLQPGVEIRYFE